jgi:CRP/FNR family transcriptional regulator
MSTSIFFKDPELLKEFNKHSRLKTLNADEVLMYPGDKIVFVPIVMKGSIRVLRVNEEGKEVFLYHINPGQTCAMSLNCCRANKSSVVKAVTEDYTEMYMIPAELIDTWFRFPEWKEFVNNTYGNRFNELMHVIDLIAFSNMDAQLLHYLNKRAQAVNTTALNITHQQIADELHTHREAVSRLLRQMEQKGLVKLGRNVIELLH